MDCTLLCGFNSYTYMDKMYQRTFLKHVRIVFISGLEINISEIVQLMFRYTCGNKENDVNVNKMLKFEHKEKVLYLK